MTKHLQEAPSPANRCEDDGTDWDRLLPYTCAGSDEPGGEDLDFSLKGLKAAVKITL